MGWVSNRSEWKTSKGRMPMDDFCDYYVSAPEIVIVDMPAASDVLYSPRQRPTCGQPEHFATPLSTFLQEPTLARIEPTPIAKA